AQADKLWEVSTAFTAHPQGALPLFHPVIRQELCFLCGVHGPWISRAEIDKARFALMVPLLIAQFPWYITACALTRRPPHAVVFLPAFAAEDEREQQMFPRTWHELLPVKGQISLYFRLQCGVDRVTSTDELMQTKRE